MTINEMFTPLTPIETAELLTAAKTSLSEIGLLRLRRLIFQYEALLTRDSASLPPKLKQGEKK